MVKNYKKYRFLLSVCDCNGDSHWFWCVLQNIKRDRSNRNSRNGLVCMVPRRHHYHLWLTAAELAAAIPETGGLTKYIEYTYGDFWGFLSGWAQSFIYFPANVAALSIVFATQLINLFHLSAGSLIPIAIASALSIVLINFLGSKAGGILQSVTLVIKLIPIIVIVIFGIFQSGDITFSLIPTTGNSGNGFFTAIGSGLLATMFAYDGWIHVGNVAGELKIQNAIYL